MPLQGAMGTLHSNGIQNKNMQKNCLELLVDVTPVLYIDNTKIVFSIGVYAGIIFVACLRFSSHGQFRHVVSCFDLLLFNFHWILL